MSIVNRLTMVVLIGLAVNLAGCLHYGHYGTRPEPAIMPPNDKNYFQSGQTTPAAPRILSTRTRKDYTVQKLRFENHTAFLYLPDGIRTAPAVIILPITQGDYYTKDMAHFLAQKGFIALRFQSHGHLLTAKNSHDALTRFEMLLREDIMDTLEGVEWLIGRSDVDPDRIGVVGISMGAIIASVVAGVDPRIHASVFILGGGNLSGILFSSEEPSVVSIRKRIEEEEDLTHDELVAEVSRRLRNVDPLTYAARLDPSRVLMINAYFDHVVRRRYGNALWEAAGEPPLIMLPTGHYSAALFFNYAERRMLDHFQKIFGPEKKP